MGKNNREDAAFRAILHTDMRSPSRARNMPPDERQASCRSDQSDSQYREISRTPCIDKSGSPKGTDNCSYPPYRQSCAGTRRPYVRFVNVRRQRIERGLGAIGEQAMQSHPYR